MKEFIAWVILIIFFKSFVDFLLCVFEYKYEMRKHGRYPRATEPPSKPVFKIYKLK